MSVGSTLTAVGFWVGALLPFVYLPVFVTGIDSAFRLLLFVGFIALNVVALVVGHDYPETRSR
ncbi:hypothetical protein OB955_08065 [Halobacteria archaeon AArc-m2/3/4]|uniref:Uncharacterized protein n=1 Tax=Natronoglomus mannanivorans TaxID=2979990 RepID=A0AAP3E0S2_9EURY|nr:hypothetical protein [Halobacteria archaeon AArc-xg1-1]MCU4972692.1 hypothetical protein [Halobacteria archaeon AArc-m2/3/4]